MDLKPGKTAPQLYVLSRSCRLHLSNDQLQAAADRQVGSKTWAKDFYIYGGYVIYLVRWSYWGALRVGRLAFFSGHLVEIISGVYRGVSHTKCPQILRTVLKN